MLKLQGRIVYRGGVSPVLFVNEEFERSLARLLLNDGKIPAEYCVSILNWLWEKNETLLSNGPLLNQQALTRLSGKLIDDRQKQALLMQCLKEARVSHAFISAVLMTFGHQDYAAFLTERRYRSIVYSEAMWDLAVQLGKGEFIKPPRLSQKDTRIRIEPYSHAENDYD